MTEEPKLISDLTDEELKEDKPGICPGCSINTRERRIGKSEKS